MEMPGKPPPDGGSGQINVAGPIFEAAEPHDEKAEDGDDRVDVTVGAQQHGPNSPTHGAAGGLEVDFASVAPLKFQPSSTTTGMTTDHAALGG